MDKQIKTRRAATALTNDERKRLSLLAEIRGESASVVIRHLINTEYKRVMQTAWSTQEG